MPEDYTQWKVTFSIESNMSDMIAFMNAMQFLVSTEIKNACATHPHITFAEWTPPS